MEPYVGCLKKYSYHRGLSSSVHPWQLIRNCVLIATPSEGDTLHDPPLGGASVVNEYWAENVLFSMLKKIVYVWFGIKSLGSNLNWFEDEMLITPESTDRLEIPFDDGRGPCSSHLHVFVSWVLLS